MKIEFSPKAQFQENKDTARELSVVVQSKGFHSALSAALAHYAYSRTPTAEQVVAIRDFISILLHLPHEDPPLPQMPIHQLEPILRRMPPTATK